MEYNIENELDNLKQRVKAIEKRLDAEPHLLNPDLCPECHELRKTDKNSAPGFITYRCYNSECLRYMLPDSISANTYEVLMDLKFISQV